MNESTEPGFYSNKSFYSENEFEECFNDDGLTNSKSISNEYQIKQSMSSASPSSVSSSFSSSSPITQDEKKINSQPIVSNNLMHQFTPKTIPNEKENFNSERFKNADSMFSRNQENLGINNPNNLNPSIAAALYGPYFMINLMQNQSMAFQTAIAQRLMMTNNNPNANPHHQPPPESMNGLNLSMKDENKNCNESMVYPNKRKTHLSNLFMNENIEIKQENSCLDQAIINYLNSTGSNIKSENSHYMNEPANSMLHHQLTHYYMNQFQNPQYNSIPQPPPPAPTRKTKINFGNISDLIN